MEAVQDQIGVIGIAAQVGQLRLQLGPRARLVQHQAIQQLVDHAGVGDEDFRKELARRAKLDVELETGRIEAKQLPEDRLAAERGGHFFEVDQGHVGIGSLGDGFEQLRRDARQEMPAAPRRQKRHRFGRELRQALVRSHHVAERVLAENRLDGGRGRVGIEDQVGFRLACFAFEGEVQKMVEDLAVEIGVGAIDRQKFFKTARGLTLGLGAALGIIGEAHALGKLAELFRAFRQKVRLQVTHQLQAMLDAAQETIGVLENAIFLVGNATGVSQRLHRLEGIALADLGQIAAVEQLQELDGEFDVADAADAGLDLGVAVAVAVGFLLDAPLQGLDAVNLAGGEILAVDERLDGLEKLLAQAHVAGAGPNLDEGLAFPGAAERVVISQSAGQRPSQGAAFAFGPQPEIDAVGQPLIAVLRQEAHDFAHNAREEIVVADAADAFAARRAVFVEKEHEVDVGAVIQLLAAVLAEGQDDTAGGLFMVGKRLAEAIFDGPQGDVQRDLQGHVGDAGNIAGHLLKRPIADDVVGADAQQLALAKAAKCAQHRGVLEGGVNLGLKLVLQLGAVGAAAQRHAQHVEIVGIGDQEIAEKLAGTEKLQQRFERSGPAFEQHVQLGRRGGVGEETFEIVERHIGVGAARQNTAQRRAKVAERWHADGRRHAAQVGQAAGRVAETPRRQERLGLLRRFQTVAELIELHESHHTNPKRKRVMPGNGDGMRLS